MPSLGPLSFVAKTQSHQNYLLEQINAEGIKKAGSKIISDFVSTEESSSWCFPGVLKTEKKKKSYQESDLGHKPTLVGVEKEGLVLVAVRVPDCQLEFCCFGMFCTSVSCLG